MRIILLRHGKPDFALKGSVPAKDLKKIAKLYDASEVVGSPPKETVAAIAGDHVVVCSHLPRSIQSARSLGYSEVRVKEPLFSETALPHFSSGFITLPMGVWMVVLRILWLFGFSRNGESLVDAKRRSKQAADKLAQLAEEHQSVLLVGHGFMNYFIAKELRKSGWHGPSKPGDNYWGYGVYEQTARREQ